MHVRECAGGFKHPTPTHPTKGCERASETCVAKDYIYKPVLPHGMCLLYIYIYLDLQSGTFTGSGAGLPTPAFFWIWSGSFSKSPYVDSQGFACFADRISVKVNPLLMQ